MDPFMGAAIEDEWQVATGSPLDFENLLDFIQMELNEDGGLPAFTSDQLAGPSPGYLSNVDFEFSLEPTFSSDQPNGPESGFVTSLDLQQIHAPVEQSSFDLACPAPAPSTEQPPYYLSTPTVRAEFVPPQTPLFAQGPDQAAHLATWYTQAAEYYQFRANLYSANDASLESFPTEADISNDMDQYSQVAVTAHMDAASFESAPQERQASPNQSSRREPARKRVDTAPAHIMKEILTSARLSKINPKQYGKRTRQTLSFDPRDVYTQGPRPESWGKWGKDNIYQYSPNGELKPGLLLSVEQLRVYMFEHPLHTDIHGHYNPRNSGLRLWIQRHPADSKRRYGHSTTSRCRLSSCVADLNLIGQAQYRVCFDERHLQSDYDPMHNAGYCHLYCLEKYFDWPRICAELNVKAEHRILPLEPSGKNRAMFSSIAEMRAAQNFINDCQNNQIPHTYPRQPHGTHEGSLCYMLAREKVAHEPRKQTEARLERGAIACFSKHMGNLEVENADRWVSRRKNRGTKRKYESDYEEESEEEEIKAPASKKKSKRPAKPARTVSEVDEVDSDEESDDDVVMEDDDDEYQPEPARGRKNKW